MRAGRRVTRDDPGAVRVVVAGERQLDVAEGRGEELGQFEIDRRALDAAERIAIRFVRAHDRRVRVMAVLAHHAGEALHDAQVRFVLVQRAQIDAAARGCSRSTSSGFLLFIRGLCPWPRNVGSATSFGRSPLDLRIKTNRLGIPRGRSCCAERIEARRERKSTSAQDGRFEKISAGFHVRTFGFSW